MKKEVKWRNSNDKERNMLINIRVMFTEISNQTEWQNEPTKAWKVEYEFGIDFIEWQITKNDNLETFHIKNK